MCKFMLGVVFGKYYESAKGRFLEVPRPCYFSSKKADTFCDAKSNT